MGFLHKLWDETLAGPAPDTGLGKLRKYDSFSAATPRSAPAVIPHEEMVITRSITILRTNSNLKNFSLDPGSTPDSPAACSTPGTPLSLAHIGGHRITVAVSTQRKNYGNGRRRSSVFSSSAAAVSTAEQQQFIANSPDPATKDQRRRKGGLLERGSDGGANRRVGERYLELSRGNLKQKHWKEVADIVSSREDYTKAAKTDIQCKNRIDTVKKKYKLEKAKIAAGSGPSKWPFFERLDQLIGPAAKIPVTATAAAASLSSKVPVGIPVGIRSGGASGSNQYQLHQGKAQMRSNPVTKNQNVKSQFRKRTQVETESSSEEEENFPDSDDSLPPEKKPRGCREE
ncbi:hypothetical protein GH714_036494 [Hevea brasiliensis]|uniref:Myb/SANT-like DNA-binding domain-containing protein n=1 Tax=Hevea brasiliensis TaxID=3981 RepID=A0A6A6NET2_HEVBR|nr:hypothetical protein GH714_036494 [Hevea brasiliensis]